MAKEIKCETLPKRLPNSRNSVFFIQQLSFMVDLEIVLHTNAIPQSIKLGRK